MTDWHKFHKVFNLDVDVQVKKEVTRQDVLLSLLEENEIAFKGKKGHFVFQVGDKWDIKIINTLITEPLKEEIKRMKDTKKKKGSNKIGSKKC